MFDLLTLSWLTDDDDESYDVKRDREEEERKKHRERRHNVDSKILKHEKQIKDEEEKDHRYTDSNRKDFKKEIIFLGALGLILLMAMSSEQFQNMEFNIPALNLGGGSVGGGSSMPPQIGTVPKQEYRGSLGVSINHRDALDITETREEGSDIITTYYKQSVNGQYYPLAFGDDEVIVLDGVNQVYISVEPVNGSNIFIAPRQIAEANPRIYDFEFFDIDQDSFQEWVFKVDLLDLPIDTMGDRIPKINFISLSFDEGKESRLSSPADIDHFGSTWIKWELIVPEETVLVVSAVRIDVETTDDNLINEAQSFIQVPFMGQIQFSDMNVVHFAKKTSYVYDIGKDIGGSNYITTKINGDTKHEIPVHIVTSKMFGGLDENLDVTLILTIASPDQKFSDIQDTVTLIPSQVDLEDITIKESIRCTDVDENNEWTNCETITKVDYNLVSNTTGMD